MGCEGKKFYTEEFTLISDGASLRSIDQELGPEAGNPVGTSLIDAYAGGVGIMESISLFELLNNILRTIMDDLNAAFAALTYDVNVLLDFHGNRSLVAYPKAKGIICGMTLYISDRQLALSYLAAMQGIAYESHHIMEHCNAHGHKVTCCLHVVAFQETVFVQEYANIIGCPIVLPRVLGVVILGAVAVKYASLSEAMMALNAAGQGCMSSYF
eukprot:XP_015579104.1 FGGY carbohydrate kinase domain-containing protein-like [Ricinus communis]